MRESYKRGIVSRLKSSMVIHNREQEVLVVHIPAALHRHERRHVQYFREADVCVDFLVYLIRVLEALQMKTAYHRQILHSQLFLSIVGWLALRAIERAEGLGQGEPDQTVLQFIWIV